MLFEHFCMAPLDKERTLQTSSATWLHYCSQTGRRLGAVLPGLKVQPTKQNVRTHDFAVVPCCPTCIIDMRLVPSRQNLCVQVFLVIVVQVYGAGLTFT
jgi:hypothetical protein